MNIENPEHREILLALESAVKRVLDVLPDDEKSQVENGTVWTYPVKLADGGDKVKWAMVILNLCETSPQEPKAKAAS